MTFSSTCGKIAFAAWSTIVGAGAVPFPVAQEVGGEKDAVAKTRKIAEEPVEHLVAGFYNAFVKEGDVSGALSALGKRGVSGVRALLCYCFPPNERPDFRIRADQWVAERAKSDPAVLQFLVDSLPLEHLGAHAARILPKAGPGAPEPVMNALHDNLDADRNRLVVNADEKKRLIERAKRVLCLLPSECAVTPVSRRFQREAAIFRESNAPTPFAIDMAYVLCARSEGVVELTGIVNKRPMDRMIWGILRGMKLVLDEAGDDLLSLNPGGKTVEDRWRGLFAAFNAEPGWKDSVAPLEKQFEQIARRRREMLEKLRKKESESKSGYLRTLSPKSFAYAAIMASRENTRSAVTRPFSERRARSDSFMDRRMASLRARSEFARHKMAS